MKLKCIENGKFIENDPERSFKEKYLVNEKTGCWEWNAVSSNGYGYFSSKVLGFINGISAHRASWLLNKGDIPDGLFVLHSCDNKRCVNPEHLFLGTQKENIEDCSNKNRRSTHLPPAMAGIKNPSAKLTEIQILKLRELRNSGFTYASLGKIFSISATQAHRIVKAKNWK